MIDVEKEVVRVGRIDEKMRQWMEKLWIPSWRDMEGGCQ